MSCSTMMSECDSEDYSLQPFHSFSQPNSPSYSIAYSALSSCESPAFDKTERRKFIKSVSKDLLRNDLPYLVHNYSDCITMDDWVCIKEILTHSNMCIFSIHSEGRYIFNITFINGKVMYINDKLVTGNTIVTRLPRNSYLIEVPSKNMQLQFTYGKTIRFRCCNKLHKYLTVISRFYPMFQTHSSS